MVINYDTYLLFIDDKVTSTSNNIIIYGHNMADDSMFGDLPEYKNQSYYEKHKYIKFDTLYEDLQFILELQPHMVGIGPFIPQQDTPFGGGCAGTLDRTLRLLSIIRLLVPHVLLPATTALGTIHPLGREKGIQAGANVVMPNLSPVAVREKYKLYDNKICTGDEAAECRHCMARRMESVGYKVVVNRGDYH